MDWLGGSRFAPLDVETAAVVSGGSLGGKVMRRVSAGRIGIGLAAAIMLAGGVTATTATLASAQSYSQMTCSELWYARNSIFAEKGYCFKSRRAIGVFGPRCYPPYGRLNQWERRQVNIIESWEYRKGCK